MIFKCSNCEKDYEETDEDFIPLGKAGQEMTCLACFEEWLKSVKICKLKFMDQY